LPVWKGKKKRKRKRVPLLLLPAKKGNVTIAGRNREKGGEKRKNTPYSLARLPDPERGGKKLFLVAGRRGEGRKKKGTKLLSLNSV